MESQRISVKMEKGNRMDSENEPSMEDWIGQLPHDVLGVIFSHLTLIEAGRTSVISHRWKDLWTLTPHFNFDFSKRFWRILRDVHSIEQDRGIRREHAIEDERRKYLKWVNQLVENYQGTDDISEFVVFFPLDGRDSCHLDKWIEFALRKRVKELKIDLVPLYSRQGSEAYSFAKSAPVISGIECLTSLCLVAVTISGEMVEQLLSMCPLLERLSLIKSDDISNLRVVGSSLKLKYLNVEFCLPLKNLQICAPNLKSFHFHRLLGKISKLEVEGLSCLVDLHVMALDITRREMRQFSSYFPQLETFTMTSDYDKISLNQLGRSQFTKLRHLTFKIGRIHGLNMLGLDKFINLSCLYLHKFTVEVGDFHDGELVLVPWDNRLRHKCLKVVEMISFIGRFHEIELAKCLLKTAINLEKLIVDTRHHYAVKMYPDDWEHKEYKAGSRQAAEQLRKMVPAGVELIII